MAKGKLGSADLVGGAGAILLFTAGAAGQVFNVRFCNRSGVVANIRLAIGPSGGSAPAPEDWIDYDLAVQPLGILEDTGQVASPGEKVWAYSNSSNVSVRAFGL